MERRSGHRRLSCDALSGNRIQASVTRTCGVLIMATTTGSVFPLSKLPTEWSKAESWLEQFSFYVISASIDDDKKKAVFLANCGTEAFDLVKNLIQPEKLSNSKVIFDVPPVGEDKISILECLTNHLKPKKILHYERFKFFSAIQKQRSVHQFVAELRMLSSTCEFDDLKDQLLLTQFIIGVDSKKLQERFLTKVGLTFETAIQEALLMEESTNAASAINIGGSSSTEICAMKSFKSANIKTRSNTMGPCKSCGELHSRQICKFRNVKCYKCQRFGHVARVCMVVLMMILHMAMTMLKLMKWKSIA